MSAIVTWSFEGSPPCSWQSLLGESPIGLKDHIPIPGHWNDHQSCNNPCVDLQCSPSCSSWDVTFLSSCQSINLICEVHALGRGVNMIYCDLGIDNLKSFDVGMICGVTSAVCHSEVCGCVLCGLRKIIMLLWWLHLSQCCDLEQPL